MKRMMLGSNQPSGQNSTWGCKLFFVARLHCITLWSTSEFVIKPMNKSVNTCGSWSEVRVEQVAGSRLQAQNQVQADMLQREVMAIKQSNGYPFTLLSDRQTVGQTCIAGSLRVVIMSTRACCFLFNNEELVSWSAIRKG